MKLPTLFLVSALLAHGAGPHHDRWRSVADRLITTPVADYPFNWGEGVQQIGLMKIYERTRDRRYLDYMERWTAQFLFEDPRVLLNVDGTAGGTRKGYCGHWSPGTAVLLLWEAKKRPEYLKLAEAVNDFIRNGAERSSEGALAHWKGNHQLWVDTLYMACPLLATLGKKAKQPAWVDDAANQIIVFAKYLQDEKNGLFYHVYDWDKEERTPSLWARGNGWVLMSIADTLEMMGHSHKDYARLRSIAGRMASGLREVQDAGGMFHTVLDEPSSYAETSASMMFTYGLLKLVRLGVLPAEGNVAVARKAWNAVNEKYIRDGIVTGVSAGTGPGGSKNYKARPVGRETWGTGAYLMAGYEVDRMK